MTTTAQQLAESRYDGLPVLVRDLAAQGLSWREIARTVATKSGGRVRLSYETLRRWYGDT